MAIGFHDFLAWRWHVPRLKKLWKKSIVIETAEAITTFLKNEFSGYRIERAYAPKIEDYEIADPEIIVVPRSWERDQIASGILGHLVEVDVAIIRPVDDTSPEQVDVVMQWVQRISDALDGKRFNIFDGATCIKIKNEPIFAEKTISQNRKFASLITASIKVLERTNAIH